MRIRLKYPFKILDVFFRKQTFHTPTRYETAASRGSPRPVAVIAAATSPYSHRRRHRRSRSPPSSTIASHAYSIKFSGIASIRME